MLSNPVLEELKRRQTYVTNENLILKYVHKKFRVSTIKTEMLDENIIREANLRLRYVLFRSYFIEIYKCIYFRKSVIVQNTYLCEKEENIDEDFEDFDNIDFDSLLTIQDIENLYTVEEGLYLKKMMTTFYDNYKLFNYGPKLMSSYIHFCRSSGPLPQNYINIDISKLVR